MRERAKATIKILYKYCWTGFSAASCTCIDARTAVLVVNAKTWEQLSRKAEVFVRSVTAVGSELRKGVVIGGSRHRRETLHASWRYTTGTTDVQAVHRVPLRVPVPGNVCTCSVSTYVALERSKRGASARSFCPTCNIADISSTAE